MNAKVTGIVSYLTPIGWIIAFLAGDKEGAKFHLNQSLVLWIIGLIFSIASNILSRIPLVNILAGIVFGILGLVTFVLWILGLVYAINDQQKELPVIGAIKLLN